MKLKRNKVFFVLSYRHPNMLNDEAVAYMNKLDSIYDSIRKENPTVSILCGDENYEGGLLNNLLISNNLEQLICEPTHIRDGCLNPVLT